MTVSIDAPFDSPLEDWQRIIQPMQGALDGDDPGYSVLDRAWVDDDPEELNPWEDGRVRRLTEEARQQAQTKDEYLREWERNRVPDPIATITYPTEADRGRQLADRRAGARGINPGKVGAGVGHMLDLARSQLGTPYVFGADGPSQFDCSGFVQWLVQRVTGTTLPHQALQQATATQPVGRDELQPGDLLFFRYGRLGGEIDHVEIYMGGGKMIGTANPTEDLDIDNVDWDNFVRGGRVKGIGGAASADVIDPMLGQPDAKVVKKPVMQDSITAPMVLGGQYGDAGFSTVLAEVLGGDEFTRTVKYKTPKSLMNASGPTGAIRRQLYQGFMDAGRPDLARMVGTRDFSTWVQQESGWNPGVTSPANNHGLANDGLFQVWRGHDFNSNGQVSRMSPYEQAMIVARYFSLTPEDIRSYATAIRNGSYHGWG